MTRTKVLTIGAKVPRTLAQAVEEAVRSHPNAFANQSDFVRAALKRFLEEMGATSNKPGERPVNCHTVGDGILESTEGPPAVNRKEKQS